MSKGDLAKISWDQGVIRMYHTFRVDQEQPESYMLVRSQNEPADITDEAMPVVNEEQEELKSGRVSQGGDSVPEWH